MEPAPPMCYDSAPMHKLLPIALLVVANIFMTYAWYGHLKERVSLDYLWAGLCMAGAAYFIFRNA